MILKKISTIELPTIKKFSGKQFDNKGFYLWSNFRDNFVSKQETKQPARKLKVSKLNVDALNKDIMAELGNYEITPGQLYNFLKTADKQEWYISYIKDTSGVLWAVNCRWGSGFGYWDVDAFPVSYPRVWNAGLQVFSCDSSDTIDSEVVDSDPLTLESLDARLKIVEQKIEKLKGIL